MQLQSITIENYRSIKNTTLEIQKIADKSCFILLGINESGKSNILKAITLKDNQSIDYSIDCEKYAEQKEEDIKIGYELSPGEGWDTIFIKQGIPEKLAKIIELERIELKLTISSGGDKTYFLVWIKNSKEFSNYVLASNTIQNKTKQNEVTDAEGNLTNLLDKEKLEKYLESDVFNSVFEHNTPEVIFWKSEEKYLINQQIDLNTFKNDTSISTPLKNCFNLAKINNIPQEIDKIVGKPSKIAALEKKLSNKVTEHINTVWPEHKISIKFNIDDMKLSFLIEDKNDDVNLFEIDQRSDGFKQFISILLSLSIENETKELKNKIILLDEPETHLHPSGQKYLMNELLKIAENNIVIYATHSIFMVDTKNLNRHLSVKKDKGVTIIEQIDKDNPYGDEVLYNALGTSVLEHINPNVLIVEGKTDKNIFEIYSQKFKTELTPPKISVISADGAKNIIKYTKFLNPKNTLIKPYVLFDSDQEGKGCKNNILKELGYKKDNTFEINDIHGTKMIATLEDLFDKKYLEKVIKDVFDVDMVLDKSKPLMKQHKDKHKTHDQNKLKKPFIEIISKLSKQELKQEKYYLFFKKLIQKINLCPTNKPTPPIKTNKPPKQSN